MGHSLKRYTGLTLKTQKEPDVINHSHLFIDCFGKDQLYESQTIYWLKNDSKGDEK